MNGPLPHPLGRAAKTIQRSMHASVSIESSARVVRLREDVHESSASAQKQDGWTFSRSRRVGGPGTHVELQHLYRTTPPPPRPPLTASASN